MPKEDAQQIKYTKKKEDILKKVVGTLQDKFGKESVNYLGNEDIEPIQRIPSQSIAIDEVTGGGYPVGRIIELFGGESSGKTTACLHAIASAQKMFPNKVCGIVDSEYAFDPVYAAAIGVNVGELVVAQPESGEDGFAILQGMIESDGFSLIVVDSVAAMVPRAEVEEDDFGKSTIGLQARMMSKALRKLTSVIGRHNVVCMFTNQTREKVGIVYGSPETTAGGSALKFYASIRLKLTKLGTIEEGQGNNKQKTSVKTRVDCVKNKTFPPFRRAEYIVTFGKGIDNEALYMQTILENFVENPSSGNYILLNGEKIRGVQKVKAYLEENKEMFDRYKKMVDEHYGSKASAEIPKSEREEDSDEDENLEEDSGIISSKK